jgi:plastocyanin
VAQRESKDPLDDQDTSALKHHHSGNTVIVGHGEIAATGGGSDSLSVMRFTDPDITAHAGDTIEWTNEDPITAHTLLLSEKQIPRFVGNVNS